MRRVLGGTALMLLLASCGSGESYSNISALEGAMKCQSATEEDPMLYASETDTCKLAGGDTVTINWFNNNDARDNYVQIGIGNGAAYVIGDNWAVECEDHGTQTSISDSIDGETKG